MALYHQDWTPVTLHRTYTEKEKHTIAKRSGNTISVEKRTNQTNTRKLAEETEQFHVQKSGITLGKEIQQARTGKKLSQKQLACMLNEKIATIQQYENGTAIPNHLFITKLQNKLGVKLTRPKSTPNVQS